MTLSTAFNKIAELENKLDLIVTMLSKLQPQSHSDEQTKFDDFARYYFDKFRWRKVSADTRRSDISRYNNHVAPVIADKPISDITPEHIQEIIDNLSDRQKTAHEVFTLINVVMKAAIKHNLIKHNPCDIVLLDSFESEHGVALTKDEELRLLAATSGTPYQRMFAVILYTGLRPNEYKTVSFDGSFVVARNSKQKDGKEHKKKIPVTPMLAPYLADMSADDLHRFKFYHVNRLRDKFKLILPEHKLYDTRTTFYTRCETCGVSDLARDLFVGHSRGKLPKAYTDVPDEYLWLEGQKFVY